MKLYRMELVNRWGEQLIVTREASSLYEAMKSAEFDGWTLRSFAVLGVRE